MPALKSTNLNDFNLSDFDFINWLIENDNCLNEKRVPTVKHIVYIEQLISGVGVHTEHDLFKQYIDVWRNSDRLKIKYNLELDCNEYFIDNILVFRKYDYGCIC